jgi:L-amino acid N-acyltransferase YncA
VGIESIVLAPLTAADWPAAAQIYQAGIDGGNATFEASAPDWETWAQKRGEQPAVVARGDDGEMLGWAALTPVSSRCVYRGVGEVSIYVDPAYARRGVGRRLLEELIAASERDGLWTLRAGIFQENVASIALHERCGFELLGVSRRIGQMPDGRWRDVLLYERRSATAGGD